MTTDTSKAPTAAVFPIDVSSRLFDEALEITASLERSGTLPKQALNNDHSADDYEPFVEVLGMLLAGIGYNLPDAEVAPFFASLRDELDRAEACSYSTTAFETVPGALPPAH